MWPDRVSNPGPLTYESGAIPTALRGSATRLEHNSCGLCRYSQLLISQSGSSSQTTDISFSGPRKFTLKYQ